MILNVWTQTDHLGHFSEKRLPGRGCDLKIGGWTGTVPPFGTEAGSSPEDPDRFPVPGSRSLYRGTGGTGRSSGGRFRELPGNRWEPIPESQWVTDLPPDSRYSPPGRLSPGAPQRGLVKSDTIGSPSGAEMVELSWLAPRREARPPAPNSCPVTVDARSRAT
jgi:hypothetical protein